MSDLIILKIKKTSKYTILGLSVMEDPRLSWKAKGLHTYLISRPPEWQIHKRDLLQRATDGDTSLRSAVAELKATRYLKTRDQRDNKGRYTGTIWEVSEDPEKLENTTSAPEVENPSTEKPQCGKATHLVNNKVSNYQKSSSPTPLTIEEEEITDIQLPPPFNKLLRVELQEAVKLCKQHQLNLQEQAEALKGMVKDNPAFYLLKVLRTGGFAGAAEMATKAREAAKRAEVGRLEREKREERIRLAEESGLTRSEWIRRSQIHGPGGCP